MRFLIIDDSPYDRELIIRKLQQEFGAASCREVIQRADFEEAMGQPDFDVVLVDYQLKWTTGLEVLKTIRERVSELPVIMVTDTGSEEIAAEGMKKGLNDYVLKKHLHRLPFVVKECLEMAQLRAERNAFEEQVRQTDKMESLGLLVSSIAHDFNNLLAEITGYADRSLSKITPSHPLYEDLRGIGATGERAARMVRQLLAFARRQPLLLIDVNLNVVITDLLDLLRKLLTETIEAEFLPDPLLKTVSADTTQIEQILLNLCLNARDAMPNGGKVLITTQNTMVDEHDPNMPPGMQPGAYVLLSVKDTGTGMNEQEQKRMFEPFFTTKEPGKGTGLGLSVVHGIIRQHRGFVQVESEVGRGTTFSLYLPAVERAAVYARTEAKKEQVVQRGTGTILLLEDNPVLQQLMVGALQERGYTVIVTGEGLAALQNFEQHAASIALVIADIKTPKMTGIQLYENIRRGGSTTRFLFVSGYQEREVSQYVVLDKNSAFLEKPFHLGELMTKVYELLG